MNALKSMGKALSATVTDKFLEKPEHEVTAKTEAYECRSYEESVWVSTTVKTIEGLGAASSVGFGKLFGYIMGANTSSQKVDMTAPVLVRIDPGAGPACETSFTVSFYVGKQHWGREPEPKEPDIYINKMPPMDVYCRVYGGFSNDDKAVEEVSALAEALQRDSINDFHKTSFFFAGYDPPFKPFGRQNEVWLLRLKTEDSKTGKSTEV